MTRRRGAARGCSRSRSRRRTASWRPAPGSRAATRWSCRPSRPAGSTARFSSPYAGIDADDLLVLGEDRVPLPGAAAEEAVEVLEAPAGGPPVERSARSLLPVGRQVPLAEGGRVVAVVAQDPRQRRAIAGQRGGVARVAAGELADRAEADGMAVAAGEQGRPRRRADGRHVEAVVADAALGHPGVVRCLDRAAERARVAEAGVVDEHEQDVRRAIGRRRMPDQVPVRLRSGERPVDDPANGGRRMGRWLRSTTGMTAISSLVVWTRDPSHQGPFRRSGTRRLPSCALDADGSPLCSVPFRLGMDPMPRVSDSTGGGHHPIDLKPRRAVDVASGASINRGG